MLNVMKRGSKWQYRFDGATIDGKRKQISKSGFATKKEAMEAGTRAMAEYNDTGILVKQSDMSVSDYMDLYVKEYCEHNVIASTLVSYKKRIRLYIKPYLGQYRLNALTPVIIQDYLNELFKEGLSHNTLTCLKGLIRGSLDYAVITLKIIRFNPASSVKLPKKDAEPIIKPKKRKTKERNAVPKDIVIKILERFPEGTSAHIPLQLAYRAGLRLGEAFALKWDDVDFHNKTISVTNQVQMDENVKLWRIRPPKYKSYRTISIDDTLLMLLHKEKVKQEKAILYYDEYYKHLLVDDAGYLNYENGKPIDMVMKRENGEYIQPGIMKHVGRVVHGYGKDPVISETWDFHSMRHTHATMLLEAGVNPKEVQHRLGHKDIKTTLNIYTHLTKKMQDDAVKIMNDIL